MSRLSKKIKTIEEAQNKIKETLKTLDEAHDLFCVDIGFCGTRLCSSINSSIRTLKWLSEVRPQELLEQPY